MKYKFKILQFILISATFTALLYYTLDYTVISALLVSIGTTTITFINGYYLIKKTKKTDNNSKA